MAKPKLDDVDSDGVQVVAGLNERGQEMGDPTPMAPPVGLRKPPTMIDQIRSMVRREMSDAASELGMESFEESEDFDIDDDPVDPHTPYEAVFDPVKPPPTKKEVEDAEAGIDKRGNAAGDDRSDDVGKERQSEPGSKPKPADKSGVRPGGRPNRDSPQSSDDGD